MKFNIQRNEEYIENLKKVIESNYQFKVQKIEEGERGLERRNMDNIS